MDLRKKDLVGVLDIIHSCIDIQNADDVKATLDQFHDIVPFSGAVVCSVEQSARDNQVFFSDVVNHSYSNEWGEVYFENDFIEVDPVVKYSLDSNRSFTWSTAFKTLDIQNPKAHDFVTMAGDYQLKDGLAHRVGDTERGTLISLAIDHEDNRYYSKLLDHITPHLHEALLRINDIAPSTDIPALTEREREVIKWTGEGKSSWEIGVILGISERTVKYHINNIKTKLNAANRAHAVAKAFRLHIIS